MKLIKSKNGGYETEHGLKVSSGRYEKLLLRSQQSENKKDAIESKKKENSK